jgi:hypothetical protein
MEIDEVSLVDLPANQYAALVIAKRAGGTVAEEDVEYFTLDGQPVTRETPLTEGQVIVDGAGNRFQWFEDEDASAAEPEDAGDSPFLADAGHQTVGKSLADAFRTELAKAQSDGDLAQVVSKMATAFAVADERIAVAEQRAEQAEVLAKGEQDLRLTAAYIAKAAELHLPGDPTELGPVLMRMEQQMDHEDCVVVAKALTAAGQMLFTEIGFQGDGGTADPLARATADAADRIAKGDLSEADAVEDYFAANPGAYADYLANLS